MTSPDHKPNGEAWKEGNPGLDPGGAAAAAEAAAGETHQQTGPITVTTAPHAPDGTRYRKAPPPTGNPGLILGAAAAKANAGETHQLTGATVTTAPDAATSDAHHAPDGPGPPTIPPKNLQVTRNKEDDGGKMLGTSQPTVTVTQIIIVMIIGVGVAVLVSPYLPLSAEPAKATLARAEVLQQELQQVEKSFGNQRDELWRRIHIHLQHHVKSTHPSEPVSLILVGGRRAERTLGCLADRLAEAFSVVYNGLVLKLDGTQLASAGPDKAKLKLDDELKKAFEGDKPAAVIHRLEELPPSSSMIFYRYCDHENAAFKHPLLAFTVLLPLDTVGPEVSLPKVEELVHGHIHQKFLIPDQPDMFDKMDVDKLSGLWNRIAHLILPVTAEEHIEKGGCKQN